MIVKCEQCQTRFKIPDEKVTDKGVKVRCTKCGNTFRVTREMDQAATTPVPSLQAGNPSDPFARFGAVAQPPPAAEVTRPGIFALGVEATRSPDLGPRSNPPPFPRPSPRRATEPNDPFDFGSLRPPTNTQPSLPAIGGGPPPPPPPATGFDFASFAGAAGPPAPPPPARAAPVTGGAFDFSPPPAAPPAFAFAPPAQPVAPAAPPAFDFGPPLGQPPQKAAPPMPAFDFGPPMPDAMPMQQQQPMHGGGGADNFFAATDSAQPLHHDVDAATARAMFDIPPPSNTLPDIPPPEPERPAPVAAPMPIPQRTFTAQIPAAGPPPRSRTIFGVVVNVLIAAVLMIGLVVIGTVFANEGKFTSESLSLEALRNTFAPSVQFVANDVSNGLYETRAGRSIFFVRGEVTNRSAQAVKIQVKAELVESGAVLRAEQSTAGAPPTPEELFLVDDREKLDALNQKIDRRGPVLQPGESAPFVVLFSEYPPDLKTFRVRVSAHGVMAAPSTAAIP